MKAAFSVLARRVENRDELQAHTRFGRRELWVIRRLVEPFERVCRERLPQAGSAHRMMLEEPVPPDTPQYNLDGWVQDGQVHALGVVDAVMVPGTQAFMRWEVPSRLPQAVQQQALQVARRSCRPSATATASSTWSSSTTRASGRLSVIECNPRLASQFGDLYQRVLGLDAHAMALALACGEDPLAVPRRAPSAGAAASLVYRAPCRPAPCRRRRRGRSARRSSRQHPDGLLFSFSEARPCAGSATSSGPAATATASSTWARATASSCAQRGRTGQRAARLAGALPRPADRRPAASSARADARRRPAFTFPPHTPGAP